MLDVAHWERVGGDDAPFDAHVVRSSNGNGQAIVLLQEIFGVNEALRDTASVFAERGYQVYVPDLFWRMQPHVDLGYDKASVKVAFSFLQRLDEAAAVQDIAATVRHVRMSRADVLAVHLVGFCLGGKLAVLGAQDRNVNSAISFYGVGLETALDSLGRAQCPLQLHFGGKDPYVKQLAVDAVKAAASGLNVEIYEYPDATHGFFSRKREGYNPACAELGLSRAIALMDRSGQTNRA